MTSFPLHGLGHGPIPSQRRWATVLLVAALLPAWAQAATSRSAGLPSAAAPSQAVTEAVELAETASATAPTAWWMAFDDATLNLLARWAREREGGLARLATTSPLAAQAQTDATLREVVASYVGARVLSARWLALNGVATATERQITLLRAADAADPPTRAERQELIATLDQRRENVARQQQALALQRAGLLQGLAGACGVDPAELGDLLAPVLARSDLPFFGSAVPARLPRSILRARADVAAAEAAVVRSLRSASGPQHEWVLQMQQSAGWIDPARGDAEGEVAVGVTDPSATARPEREALDALLAQAAQEVAQNLRTLNERARVQAERAQLADASRQAFTNARQQLAQGQLSELLVLEQYQRLLAESDRYASACGELAMAWVQLVASTGASPQVLVRR
jgi:hypothetical protein